MINSYVLGAILIMSLVTMATRFAPFLIFSGKETPHAITYLGKVLPYAIMGMLVVFCFKNIGFAQVANWLPELIAGFVTVACHVYKRNTLLSIIVGTVCYMLLVQFVFV